MVRPHGVAGDVVVELVTNRTERVAPGAVLYVQPGGAALTVEAARPVPGATHRGRRRWVVRFAGVAGREGAESLRGAVLSAPPLDDAGVLWVHELVGARVASVAGESLGTVAAVEANPASDLLVLDGGGLIPLRFVTERGDGWLRVDIPPGLLEP